MTTLYYSHPIFLKHNTGPVHPESADRLQAIEKALSAPPFASLVRKQPPKASLQQILRVHSQSHIDTVFNAVPRSGLNYIDNDTILSPASADAALYAAGALCDAVDRVLDGEANNAFCAVRPPGHHATPDRAMGFCLFNSIAIGAEQARTKHRIKRLAIVDFDVHHGNGTQAIFEQQPRVLYASTHQAPPLFPGTGFATETGVGNIFNVPLEAGSNGAVFRQAFSVKIVPALDAFKPELLMISAGFDAHRDDPLATLNWQEEDFSWVTETLVGIAKKHCDGRIVSTLEGGYHLTALGRSVAAHLKVLLG